MGQNAPSLTTSQDASIVVLIFAAFPSTGDLVALRGTTCGVPFYTSEIWCSCRIWLDIQNKNKLSPRLQLKTSVVDSIPKRMHVLLSHGH